ncbi:GDSL esterase/lipase [Thalictrum thalictroides]|uniref:GDSL esterase/lipase n=1 Tax=Thalictrum thalictroides TaxID=46969 RepID=A0A7J6WD00_THATH|nr:GDSL esterase/lipase [Thalictrum thalictroides]
MEKKLFLSFVFLVISFVTAASHNVPAIFSFGDSLFDAGNNHFNRNCTVQADFPPYGQNFFHHPTGRFTNGRTVVDFISQLLNIDIQKPYLEAEMEIFNGSRKDYPSNGLNFASAGSGVLNETNKNMGVMAIQDQLRLFINLIKQDRIDKNLVQQSMFFIESGSNDIFNYFLPVIDIKPDPEAFVQDMLVEVQKLVDEIYKLGARRIALFSLGPVGCVPARVNLPEAPISKCYGKMNKIVKRYNAGLESLVKDMPIKYPGTIGVYGAIYNIVQLLRAKPGRYGFTNTSGACCGDGTLGGIAQCGTQNYTMCENPNKFLFWDYFHPTEHSYKLIAKDLWSGKRSRIRPYNLKDLANIALRS